MGSKKTTTQHQQNSLPDWLTTPYQQATQAATNLYQSQPSLGAGTQGDINQISANADAGRSALNGTMGILNNLSLGSYGQPALTDAANGSYLSSNPWANGGQPIAISSALDQFAANGMGSQPGASGAGGYYQNWDGRFVKTPDQATQDAWSPSSSSSGGLGDLFGLNKTANGDFLSPDSNPYIKSVANQAADAAQARTNGLFGSNGRTGGLWAQNLGQGIANATGNIYAQNFSNERQNQLGAQNTLFGAEQTANQNALTRQFGAASDIFGAQNSANESAASRASNAYEAERQRQQGAAGGLINTQLQAAAQQPGLLQAIMNGDIQSFTGHQYQDNAPWLNLQKYTGLLTPLAAPYGISDSKTTEKSSGLGSILGTVAGLGGALSSAFGNPFSSLAGNFSSGSPFTQAFSGGGGIPSYNFSGPF